MKLQLYIADDASTFRPATGHVVRVETLAPGDAGPWLRRVAVHFTEPRIMYADEVRLFHKRAERLGLESRSRAPSRALSRSIGRAARPAADVVDDRVDQRVVGLLARGGASPLMAPWHPCRAWRGPCGWRRCR